MDTLKKIEMEFIGIRDWFRAEIASLRTGRATPALVENIEVESYSVKTPLKNVASISVPDARTLVIQPWDASSIGAIISALEHSSLHITPIPGSDHIRLHLPQLTEERRKDLLKVLGAKTEDTRVRARRVRDEALKEIQTLEKEKKIREDERFRLKETLQKKIDAFNEELEEARKKKEKEIKEI